MKKIGNEQVMEIEILRIHPDSENKNVHSKENLEGLKASIKAHGVLQPIAIRSISKDQYKIIYGEGRWQACKELGMKTIPARICQIFEDIDVTSMRLAENSVRTWNQVSESQEFARLNSQGLSVDTIANRFALAERTIRERIAIGKIPDKILTKIRNGSVKIRGKNESWPYSYIRCLLPLKIGDNYQEIGKAVDLINAKEMELEELKTYVAERRLELKEKNEKAELEAKLASEMKKIRQEQEKMFEEKITVTREKLSAENERKVTNLQTRLDEEIKKSRQLREEKAELATQHPQEIKKIRQELKEQYDNSLKLAEQEFQKQSSNLQTELAEIRTKQKEAIDKAKTAIEKEYQTKINAVRTESGKEAQAIIKRLESEMQDKITCKEKEVKLEFQKKLSQKDQELKKAISENERTKKEMEMLQTQLEKHPEEIQKLELEYQKDLEKKEEAIATTEEKMQKLLEEIEQIKADVSEKAQAQAQEIAEQKSQEIRLKLEKEYEEKSQVLEKYHAELEEKLRTKVAITVGDATAHFVQTASGLELSLNTLQGILEHMEKTELFRAMTAMAGIIEKITNVFPDFREQLYRLTEPGREEEIPNLPLLLQPKEVNE